MEPVHLSSLLTDYQPKTSMCLRSVKKELQDNKRTAKGYGNKAFTKSLLELCNALPNNIRNSSSAGLLNYYSMPITITSTSYI